MIDFYLGQLCPKGFYADKPATVNCSRCNEVSYSENDGSSSCSSCPSNSVVRYLGATSITDCICNHGNPYFIFIFYWNFSFLFDFLLFLKNFIYFNVEFYGYPGQECRKCPKGGICNGLGNIEPIVSNDFVTKIPLKVTIMCQTLLLKSISL